MKSASRLSQGFPAKVVRSIDAVHLALDRFGPSIYILRRIINDENVVESLADIGAMTVEALDEIPDEGIVVLPVRASPQEYEKAASKNLQVIDDVHTLEESGHQDRHEFLGITIVGGRLNLVSLSPDGHYKFIDSGHNLHNIIHACSLEHLSLRYAIEEFEEMINRPDLREEDFHQFFERYPQFILNDEYKAAHSKIVLERDTDGPLIPDFVLEPANRTGLSDILELKTPETKVFVLRTNRIRFSAEVMEAVAQLREYSLYFDERKDRENIAEKCGLLAYKPRMFVVLGRTTNVNPLVARMAELDLSGVTLRTYDDILDKMKAKIQSRPAP